MSETELIKILCRQILLNKYIKFDELKKTLSNYVKKTKISADFNKILGEILRRLDNVGLNAIKITKKDEDYIVITIPFDSQYVKKDRLDEISISLLTLIINKIQNSGGKILQSELEESSKNYLARLKSFISSGFLKLVDIEGEYEKYYTVTPLGIAIILDAKEHLKEILEETATS